MYFTKNIGYHDKESKANDPQMNFWVHLKLLLWKNWLLRKRNKCRTITEVLWPLLLMLMVVLLHQIGRKYVYPNCYMKPKAMPTAGEVLFLQTLLCTVNNTCDQERNATMPNFNSSLVYNLAAALKEAFDPSSEAKLHDYSNFLKADDKNPGLIKFKNWMVHFLIIESLLKTLKKSESTNTTLISLSEASLKNLSFTYTCSNTDFSVLSTLKPEELGRYLIYLDKFLKDKKRRDVKLLSRAKRKIYITGVLNSFYEMLTRQPVNEKVGGNSLFGGINILDYLFCGPNVPSLQAQINSLIDSGRKKSKETEETMDPMGSKYVVEELEWENDTTNFCNQMMRKIESTYSSRVVFRLFKPLIRGKLIYTPDAPVIKRVMSKINETLSQVNMIIDLIKNASKKPRDLDYRKLQEVINNYRSDDSFLRSVVQTEVGKILLKRFSNVTEEGPDKIEKDKENFKKILDDILVNWRTLYSNDTNTAKFLDLIPYLECVDNNRIIPMRNESLAIKEALRWLNQGRLWGLVVFVNISEDAEELPKSLTYKIRTGIERTPNTNQIRDRIYVPKVRRNVIYDLREVTGGFAYLQNIVEGELIREYTGREHVPGIYLQQMPYPCHIYDSFRDVITRTFPLFMVISWMYIFCTVSKRIVLEKEILFKGTLRIFGITSTQHWISWFIDAFIPMVLVTSLLSVLLVKGGLIPNSSILLIWLFLTSFALPTITLAFMVSTFFFKASFAMAVSGMIYFLLYLPYPPIQNFAELIDPNFKVSLCLISNVAFGLGCTWIANMEETGEGAQLDKINFSPIPGNPITMGLIIQMFLIDSLIYLLLAIYFDNVIAVKDFVRHPWYYCITPRYWRRSPGKNKKDFQPLIDEQEEKDPRYFEDDPKGLRVGIEVVKLTKEFGSANKKKKAVNNLTINFYEDQITSFLGHNGAGKTTTISMMIGLLPITEGTVLMYGVDIKNNPNIAINDIGICRQENVLLDDLTIKEHLKLFAQLKNLTSQEVENNVKQLLTDLELDKRADQPIKILSGGMKRKVCVAIAFIGGSRTVFLDEPTAGIDPYSRRSIWELLVKYKKGRTIILTTHFLDEADILGDRIAIISSGELQCCGSGVFLKTQLGRGYYLTIDSNIRSDNTGRKTTGSKDESELSPHVQQIYTVIKTVIPEAEFSEQIGSEIVFILPTKVQADDYNKLFTELDKNKNELNFNSYGVTDTSLEEVFLKILFELEEKENKKLIKKLGDTTGKPDTFQPSKEEGIKIKNTSQRIVFVSKHKILKEHFIAIFIKRFLHHKRNYKIWLIEILLPTLFMAIALALAKTLPAITEMPPLVIDMAAYAPSTLFYVNQIPQSDRILSYEEDLLGPYGFGTKCILSPQECSKKVIEKGSLKTDVYRQDPRNCSCKKGFFECYDHSNYKPPNTKMSTGDTLYNLTGLNLTNWLINTEYDYSSHRLGGISFGYFNSLTGVSAKEFLNLFQFENFFKILEKSVVNDDFIIDSNLFTLLAMTASCNRTFGEQLFSSRDLEDNIIVWFNNRGWIAGLAMMNGVTNLVLRASLPNGTDVSKYSIRLINHPLPITKRQLEDQIELQTNVALLCALSVIWALSFIPAMYAVYIVEERVSGLKHLQIVSGISRVVYWSANMIWDLLSYCISILPIVCLYFPFEMTSFIGKDSILTFVTILYCYGFVNITFAYAISFMFSVSSNAFIFVACWNILTGVTTLFSTFTSILITSKENPYYLNTIFMIFPQFCFGKSLINMELEGIRSQSLENFGVKIVTNRFDWNLTSKYIVVMFISGVVFMIITFLLEYRIFQRFMFNKQTMKKLKLLNTKGFLGGRGAETVEDEDVRKERERITSGKAKADDDVLIINNLTKMYSKKESPAVDHICVGIKHGECFGLLGLNGAGKTTVFKMLTGDVSPSEGDATIGGYSITKNARQAKLLVGYCPQANALDPYLTADEHLSFFCRIRGVTGERREKEISLNIERLGLTELRNKIVKVLSGGNKRKVNTAIALVCDPELVLLDEPTSGMDVLSRRFLWNCLQNVVMEGRCVVLTSHSMEECQALCTQLSIMVNGKFTCFGSIQHLKYKFDEGYTVTVRLNTLEKTQDVMKYFEENLPDSTLLHIHYLQMKYRLSPQIFIGTVFMVMSQAKGEQLIQDYSISQTTLESIFLKLAMSPQENSRTKPKYGYFKSLFLGCGRKKLLE